MVKGSVFRFGTGFLALCSCDEWDKMERKAVESTVSHYKRINFKDFSADIVGYSVTRSCFSNGHDVGFEIKSDIPFDTFDEPREVTFSD